MLEFPQKEKTADPTVTRSGFRIASSLGHDERGAVAIVFGITALFVVSAVGGAIDFGRAFAAREQAQSAIDMAVLAAARVWQTENDVTLAKQKGLAHFQVNKPENVPVTPGTFLFDEVKNTIRLSAEVQSPAPFLGIMGKGVVQFGVEAEAQLSRGVHAGRNLEVSMMLDITGSMAGNKIASLRQAAKDLVDIVVWDDQSQYKSRVALVPFAEAVRPGAAYLQAVRGNRASTSRFEDNNGNWQNYKLTDCVSDRKGNEAMTDAAPVGKDKAGQVYTRSGSCTPTSTIVPLSSDKTALKLHIDGFTAGGLTAGQIGTQWAWYMLSPSWNAIWPAASQAGPYGDPKVLKVAVLMTDGEYNLAYDDAGVATRDSGRNASNGSADGQARLLCNAMKATGITIFTVGFELNSTKATETLRLCATDPSYFYEAEDGETLKLAFRDIAQRLSKFHLSH
jgi:Flp pilus assembly protein TadG